MSLAVAAPKGLSKLTTAAITAAALMAGAGGALGLAAFLKPAAQELPAAKALAPQEFEVEWKIIDGNAAHTVRPVK